MLQFPKISIIDTIGLFLPFDSDASFISTVFSLIDAGYMIAGSIGSTVIVEQVFSLPGIGGLLISAIEENNFPIVQILVLFMLGAYLVMSFVIDILYTVLDPRVDLK